MQIDIRHMGDIINITSAIHFQEFFLVPTLGCVDLEN